MTAAAAAPRYPLSDLFKWAGGQASSDGSTDPELQYFLDQGYLTPQASGGEGGSGQTIYSYDSSKIPAASNGAKFGDFWTPGGISGVLKQVDPTLTVDDPNYGKITPNWNQYQQKDWTSWGYPLMMAALTAGMGSAIGAVGGAAAGAGAGALDGAGAGSWLTPQMALKLPGVLAGIGNSGGNPASLLGLLKFIPGMESIAPYIQGAGGIYSAAQQRNPVAGAATLAQLFGHGG